MRVSQPGLDPDSPHFNAKFGSVSRTEPVIVTEWTAAAYF